MNLYRYEWREYASLDSFGEYSKPNLPNPKLVLITYNLFKETPKGYWIGFGKPVNDKLKNQAKWVSKTARKRYAYPSKKEALNNFILRNEMRIKILTRTIRCCQITVSLAKSKLDKIKNNG